MTRLARTSRVLRRFETRIAINYARLSLYSSVLFYFLVAHWCACLLILPTTFYDSPVDTWLGGLGYCLAVPQLPHPTEADWQACAPLRGLRAQLIKEHGVDEAHVLAEQGICRPVCYSPAGLYVATFYITLQLICGASGGTYEAESFNTSEQLLFSFVAVVGALVWGFVIGNFISVIHNVNPDTQWFRSTFDSLNHFMAVAQLPTDMRRRLREYFHQAAHVSRGQQRNALLQLMSPSLQGEVAMHVNRRWLSKVRFLVGAEKEMLVLVAVHLRAAVFAPAELATPGYLYMIHKGVALYGGRVLNAGKCWGVDMILRRQSLCRYTARAMTYLEVYRISRADLLELARPFPKATALIRWEVTAPGAEPSACLPRPTARSCTPPPPLATLRIA